MTVQRLCKFCGGFHDVERWPGNCLPEENWNRSSLPAPFLCTDSMTPVQSMLDGKMYDSKSVLRSTYKQAGVTEVGNDSSVSNPKPMQKKRPDRQKIRASIRRAWSQVGMGAPSAS
jgi:hypothetical protein